MTFGNKFYCEYLIRWNFCNTLLLWISWFKSDVNNKCQKHNMMRKLSNSLHYCWHYSHAIAFLLILTLYLLIKSVYYIQVHASSNTNKVNCVLPQNTKFKRFKILAKSQNLSVVKYTCLKIVNYAAKI